MSERARQWIEIDPCDTLFFRGTESMVAGENHEAQTMFPPMPATIIGAIRTALLGQQHIAPRQYIDNPGQWQQQCPLLGTPEKPGFSLVGPLLTINSVALYPAPAHWMADLADNAKDGSEITVQAGEVLADSMPGLCGSVARPFWIRRPCAANMKPLAGYWVTAACFPQLASNKGTLILRTKPHKIRISDTALIPLTSLMRREERVGIALTKNRTVKSGHLYATRHIRLVSGVKLLAAIESDHPCNLQPAGVLQLGGEQRICAYRLVAAPALPDTETEKEKEKYYYALSPLPADLPDSLQTMPRASGKLLRVGGWDMQKGFHKPLSAWFPAGTVIQQNTEQDNSGRIPGCISI